MRGLEFEVVWWDQDVVEYGVTCANGYFAGNVKMYANHDDLRQAGEGLRGFPRDGKDSRILELGTFQPDAAGGGIQAEFRCVDSVGHAIAFVKLRDDACTGMGEAQSVCLLVPVEAGAIDSFVSQACSIRSMAGAKAYLHMADPTRDWVRKWFERRPKP